MVMGIQVGKKRRTGGQMEIGTMKRFRGDGSQMVKAGDGSR